MDKGRKDDLDKTPIYRGFMEYFPHVIEEIAKVSAFGAEKYEWGNCFKVQDAINRYKDAAYRHQVALLKGEECDLESGLPHEAHMLWNLLFVRELQLREEKSQKRPSVGAIKSWRLSAAQDETPEEPSEFPKKLVMGAWESVSTTKG